MKRTIITGTGAFIPEQVKKNEEFIDIAFYSGDKERITQEGAEIVEKFSQITGIMERRYAPPDMGVSDIGAVAARIAIEDSGIDPETIDHIIVAHNFGDILSNSIQSDAVPSIASRIKARLGIRNPHCIPYDLLFGCPGWLQGLIQADQFFKAGAGRTALIVGTETLSRVIDKHDRDSMIFSDGAGASLVQFTECEDDRGLIASNAVNHAIEEAYYISMSTSYHPEESTRPVKYMKMKGRKVYEYALTHVPNAIKETLDKAGIAIDNLKKIFIHQANEKMDDAIVKKLYKLYGKPVPKDVTPMSIHWLGNSSVATIPTLLDMVRRGTVEGHTLSEGDVILFASVGAGMNINCVCYRM